MFFRVSFCKGGKGGRGEKEAGGVSKRNTQEERLPEGFGTLPIQSCLQYALRVVWTPSNIYILSGPQYLMSIYDTSLGQALPTLPALPLLAARLSLTFTPMLSRGPLTPQPPDELNL